MRKKHIEQYLKESVDLQVEQNLGKIDEEWTERLVNHFEQFPKKLYKYVKLNRFAFDSIERDYIYLCPANKLDDQFECQTRDISLRRFKQTKDEQAIYEKISKMLPELLSNYPIPIDKEQIASIINKNRDCMSKPPSVTSIAEQAGHSLTNQEKAAAEKLEKSNLSDEGSLIFEKLYSQVNEFQKTKGIGSLTECKSSQVMWEMYADHYKGICIEYELFNDSDIFLNTFPVKYVKKRNSDLLKISLGIVLDNFVIGLSGGMIKPTNNMRSYIEILLTKYTEWSFQKEWRIIGKPKDKIRGVKIKRIFVGKNVSEEKFEKLSDIAKQKGIRLYRQYDDKESLQIKYAPLE